MAHASIRVETERSLNSREAILENFVAIARSRAAEGPNLMREGILELSDEELAEYVTEIVPSDCWLRRCLDRCAIAGGCGR